MKKLLAVSLVLLTSSVTKADQGDLIVKLNKNAFRSLSSLVIQTDTLVESLDIVQMRPEYRVLDSQKLLEIVRQEPGVEWAQLDHPVTLRETVPNDPDFAKQWNMKSTPEADIAATLAWDLGKGGKTIDGNDVVLVVVDQGVEIGHPSLKENIWVNAGEVAGNGIDDDQNGYVDDVNGWNAVNNTGTLPGEYHATHVAGIMGARGNDSAQVVGVNWDTKIMSVRALGGSEDLTSIVLRAYGYVLKQKELWLESSGKLGANIVVTNSSFGVDYAKCDSGEYPAWDEIYNAMGEAGILSAAATANMGIDVDKVGDVPTGCSSDYLVTVTNTDSTGKKNNGAGWGLTTIDIGAPGSAIWSTYTSGGTKFLTGTSMATPHVAGAVGFLHSVSSQEFRDLVNKSPAEGALLIKKALLEGVSAQADLAGQTVSGGRLNLQKSAAALATYK